MPIKEQDYLNNLEIKVINDPLITEELKAVLNGEPTNNKQAKLFAERIQFGVITKQSATRFVERVVTLEENAGAQLDAVWSQ